MSKYVPYHAESIRCAKDLTKEMKTPLEKYKAITAYVSRFIAYDYIRAIQIPKKGGLPDVGRCWKLRMGICLDIAAMTTGMLRAVGIPTRLCFGYADNMYHAWVESTIDNKVYRYDHDGKAKVYKVKKRY